jgi:hypothetical protein
MRQLLKLMAELQESLRRRPAKTKDLDFVERWKSWAVAAEDTAQWTQRESTETGARECTAKVQRNASGAAAKKATTARAATTSEASSRHEFHQIRASVGR